MRKIYIYQGKEYDSISALRIALRNVSIPAMPSDLDFARLGVTVSEEEIPAPTLDEVKAAKKAELAEARWREEVGGIAIDGVSMYTDRESQAKYTAAVVAYTAKGVWPPSWKGMDGWLKLPDGNALMALVEAVEMRIAALFVKEEKLSRAVDEAGTIKEAQDIQWETP